MLDPSDTSFLSMKTHKRTNKLTFTFCKLYH